MAADDPRHDVQRVFFLGRQNLEPVAAQEHGAFGAVKFQAAHAGRLDPGRAFAPLTNGLVAGIFDDHILRVGHFAIVLEEMAAAGAGDSIRARDAGDPVHDIERMLTKIGHLPAGIVPEPPEMVDRAVRVVRP